MFIELAEVRDSNSKLPDFWQFLVVIYCVYSC